MRRRPSFADDRMMYETYVDELGTRLRPVAGPLAKMIMDGTAGEVPEWGYKMLNAGPREAVGVLTPYLTSDDVVLRERATVTLGFMGSGAASAREALLAAAGQAPTPKEKRLSQWAARKVAAD